VPIFEEISAFDGNIAQPIILISQHEKVAWIRLDASDPWNRKSSQLAPPDNAINELTCSATWVKDCVACPGWHCPE
jgi:hypothetical protein